LYSAENLSYLWSYGDEKVKTEKNVKCVRIIKCVKVRALFVKNKVRFARAEQLCISVTHNIYNIQQF